MHTGKPHPLLRVRMSVEVSALVKGKKELHPSGGRLARDVWVIVLGYYKKREFV